MVIAMASMSPVPVGRCIDAVGSESFILASFAEAVAKKKSRKRIAEGKKLDNMAQSLYFYPSLVLRIVRKS